MQDVEDEPLFAERVAGLDIGKAAVEVAILVPSDTRRAPPGTTTWCLLPARGGARFPVRS